MGIRKKGADAVEPSHCEGGLLQKELPGTRDLEDRDGRQRKQHKGPDMLPHCGAGMISAGPIAVIARDFNKLPGY